MTATKRHKLPRLSFLCFVCLLVAHTALAIGSDAAKPAPPKPAASQDTSVIIVNERTLVGPNSAAQLRGGRLFLPVASIAQALGDTFSSDSTLRIVTIRRQNGTTAIFNAALNEVRENGALVLTVSGTADLVFPPTPKGVVPPADMFSPLFAVIFRRDKTPPIVINQKVLKADTIRSGAKHA